MQLRAGESVADAAGIGNSNPVNKQSQYAQLTPLGHKQIIHRVAPALAEMLQNTPAWIWPSINSCSYQTATLLAYSLGMGQSRVVPEYSFLDPRGLGALDGKSMANVVPLLREGDASSPLWKPPRGAHCPRLVCAPFDTLQTWPESPAGRSPPAFSLCT
jgi:broad specificity phosphatase PhoE